MPVIVSPMREEDIDGGIRTIQEAFANDPYNLWIYNDRSKVSCVCTVSFHEQYVVWKGNIL